MNPFAEIVNIIFIFYIDIVLLRFFMQYFRVDFYNPLAQFVVHLTDIFIKPLRRFIPGFGGIDVSSLILAWLVGLASIFLLALLTLSAETLTLKVLLIYPFLMLISATFNLFLFLIIARAILSWFADFSNPIVAALNQLTEPLIRPFRRILPKTPGIDLSPMVAILAVIFVRSLIEYYLFPLIM
ncbi:MAG: YggT family protein [Gammaproteobacteria bacterium]|nr:YggT family protein [Gammaproteobacteria bacterium]MDH5629726.1 YggT family protein [Gammaproteobacteria bacterium]